MNTTRFQFDRNAAKNNIGKISGTVVGYAFLNLPGALVGASLGHIYDNVRDVRRKQKVKIAKMQAEAIKAAKIAAAAKPRPKPVFQTRPAQPQPRPQAQAQPQPKPQPKAYVQPPVVRTANPKECYYRVLGLNSSASNAQVKAAFQRLSKQYHPDYNHSTLATAQMINLNRAYEMITKAG
ncbi:MAG: DnaJ domain-containing protein [Alphaproteobacteria bacterium]|nr:DnaJ domain-containing protein [Alphaproteobacteria bacterium]